MEIELVPGGCRSLEIFLGRVSGKHARYAQHWSDSRVVAKAPHVVLKNHVLAFSIHMI